MSSIPEVSGRNEAAPSEPGPDSGDASADKPANAAPGKVLTPAARRALEEAMQRQRQQDLDADDVVEELGGPRGLEPTRYGDWERKGLSSDF